jgi:CrcB protein
MSGLVGLGGFFGSILRYSLGVFGQRFSVVWPLGTFTANVLGCFAIGLIMAMSAKGDVLSPEMKLALATGFCGGFTTLSSMMYETSEMLRSHEYVHAGAYVALTLVFSLAAFYFGLALFRIFFR